MHNSGQNSWQTPTIICPNCGQAVNDIRSGNEQVPIGMPSDTALGLPKPDGTADMSIRKPGTAIRFIRRAMPCACQVTTEWAEACVSELERRALGLQGKPVELDAATQTKLEAKRLALLQHIETLMVQQAKLQANPGLMFEDDRTLPEVERDLIMSVNQLMVLTPGKHNLSKPIVVSEQTERWADKFRYKLPPQTYEPKPEPATLAVMQSVMMGAISKKTACEMLGLEDDMALSVAPMKLSAESVTPILDKDGRVVAYQEKLPHGSSVTYSVEGLQKLINLAGDEEYKLAGYLSKPVVPAEVADKVKAASVTGQWGHAALPGNGQWGHAALTATPKPTLQTLPAGPAPKTPAAKTDTEVLLAAGYAIQKSNLAVNKPLVPPIPQAYWAAPLPPASPSKPWITPAVHAQVVKLSESGEAFAATKLMEVKEPSTKVSSIPATPLPPPAPTLLDRLTVRHVRKFSTKARRDGKADDTEEAE